MNTREIEGTVRCVQKPARYVRVQWCRSAMGSTDEGSAP
jgi:hypothetical protein